MIDQFEVTVGTVKECMKRGDDLFFVNIRHHTDWDTGLLKADGALRLADDQLEKNLDKIPQDRTVIVYSTCPGDRPSIEAAHVLQRHGMKDVHPLRGGFKAYLQEGLPVQEIPGRSTMKRVMLL